MFRFKVWIVLALAGLCGAAAWGQQADKAPRGNVSVGWTYLDADQGGYRTNLNGWFARPQLNLPKGWSVFFDSTNYYGNNHKGSANSHGFTFGSGRQFLRKKKLKPTLFAEAGDVRSSSAGTITNQFAFAAGMSLAYSLGRRVAFIVTPGEWVYLHPDGESRNDYNAKVGLSFNF